MIANILTPISKNRNDPQELNHLFSNLNFKNINLIGEGPGPKLDYFIFEEQPNHAENCVAIRINRLQSARGANNEMRLTALKNKRCAHPFFCFSLSWPQSERPGIGPVMQSVEHTLRQLHMQDCQYILTVHQHPFYTYCKIVLNRIHPINYQAKSLKGAQEKLHLAARQCEIIHHWTHENGIFIAIPGDYNFTRIIHNPLFKNFRIT